MDMGVVVVAPLSLVGRVSHHDNLLGLKIHPRGELNLKLPPTEELQPGFL